MASYHKIEPQPAFTITSRSSHSLVQMLQGNELDIAFVSYPASADPLRTELTFKEELALFAPTNGDDKFDPKRWRTNSDLPLIVQRQPVHIQNGFCRI